MRPAVVLALLATLCLAPVAAAAAEPDPLIGRQLKSLDYQYEIDDDGDYQLVFELDDGRTQLVFVRSTVESFGSVRVREIWSPGYESKGSDLPAAVANRLLADSQDSKLGGWVKQDKYGVFVVKIPADADAETLDDAMAAAFRTADQMEAELTPGKDAF
ncbi:hypothetical protein ACFOED_04255 [Vulcaniibacterium thermophilum]|jgi:hypothetical protein|uniref:Uncharacterized protein n=1 Tax=Vulcaniibacterium thermophilum TaxID=1169913 RepID=A0A918YW88_9GAMM|nr:hypothetical protein [Vulcaniibacterium thermophilum]GHE26280.1 hypothetical protein GCM10007167_04310 [Vulcaniibacterium thermophilum]